MTSPLVKLVLTLALGVCSLQGISCLDDRVKKLGKCLAKTKTKLMKADETISQFTKKSCQLSTQQTTQFNEILTYIKKLVNQNEKLVNQIEKLVNQNEKLVHQNEQLVHQLSKKGDTGKLLTSIASRITNTEKTIDDIHNSVLRVPAPCADVHTSNPRPVITLLSGLTVVCDTTTDNGGWVVFQRRTSGEIDFYRNWQQYKDGFGDKPNNFWLGLEAVHQLTIEADHELRVDMKYKGKNYFAHYNTFRVLGEDDKYKLEISGYSGDAGDSLARVHNGHYFSTKDRDHDTSSNSCAQLWHGAWWYRACHDSNLNGLWASTDQGKGLNWNDITGVKNSVSFSEMKFRLRRP